MTMLGLLFLALLPTVSANLSEEDAAEEVRFYVSVFGKDTWSGRLSEPDSQGTDGPLATLHACQRRVREYLRSSSGARRPVSVLVREGIYSVKSSLLLTADDSGEPGTPVTWRNYPGERAVLSGGARLQRPGPLLDQKLLDRLPLLARAHVKYLDLRRSGIVDYGTVAQRGSPGLELFQDGVRMTPARWPNQGWARIADVPQQGDSLLHPGLAREQRYDGVPAGRHYGVIRYDGDRPGRWGDIDQIFLHGYWTFDWSDSYQRVQSIDPARSEIVLAPPHHHYGYTKNQRYRAVNVLEELDTPGEWFLNRRTGQLVFWPPDSLDLNHIEVSMLEEPLVILDGATSIAIRGFTLTVSRGPGVVMRGGKRNVIAGCMFTNLGDDAVIVDGGTGHRVQSCDIRDGARGGIRLSGGDRATLVPAGNVAENNHIHHWSRWLRTGNYAIIIDGVGNTAAHNLIHDAPFEAIYVKGNDHRIEYNDIHHVTQETGDAGALHTGRDWTWRGNVIRHNYFHDLKGPGLHGVMGVYLDDWASGFRVYGNLFYRAGRATLIGGGRDNVVDNNIYIECSPSVHVDARGLGWAGYYFDGSRPELFTKLEEMHFRSPPYSERYPELQSYLDENPAIPKNNQITRNISWGGRWLDVYDFNAFDLSVVTIRDNIVADSIVLRRRAPGLSGWDPYYLNIDLQDGYEHLTLKDEATRKLLPGNYFDETPVRFDPASRSLYVRDQALLDRIAFEPLQIGLMGLRPDEFRSQDLTLSR
jgi:hypothetical protein